MRIPIILIIGAVVLLGALVGVAAVWLLRKAGMKDDVAGDIKSGGRCEMCEQTTVSRSEDGRLSCYGCGHVSEAPGGAA